MREGSASPATSNGSAAGGDWAIRGSSARQGRPQQAPARESRSAMTCQLCNKNPATIHVTDLRRTAGAEATVSEQHVCEGCAQALELPSAPVPQKNVLDIWKLLQRSAQKARTEGGLTCPECGISLAEFRSKGRLGCATSSPSMRRDWKSLTSHWTGVLWKSQTRA